MALMTLPGFTDDELRDRSSEGWQTSIDDLMIIYKMAIRKDASRFVVLRLKYDDSGGNDGGDAIYHFKTNGKELHRVQETAKDERVDRAVTKMIKKEYLNLSLRLKVAKAMSILRSKHQQDQGDDATSTSFYSSTAVKQFL